MEEMRDAQGMIGGRIFEKVEAKKPVALLEQLYSGEHRANAGEVTFEMEGDLVYIRFPHEAKYVAFDAEMAVRIGRKLIKLGRQLEAQSRVVDRR